MKISRYFITCAAVSCASVAYADSFTFSTPVGATAGGQPVNVTAVFVTGFPFVQVTIINNQANPTSIIQAVSDLFFDLSSGTSGSLQLSAGGERNIAADGTFTNGSVVDTGWALSNVGSTFHLNVLGTAIGPAHLLIGPPDINSNVYSNAKGSIAGNGPHNPFLAENATFFITDRGITADTQVSNVVFSFGTEAGTNVPANTPDSGATVALLGLGLIGLAAARAKFGKA
jgi:VPDSG-CTERM motif